jgi:hypothetical protein
MPEDIEFDLTDQGTLRPNTPPLKKKGDYFDPLEIKDFELEITLLEHISPDDPIILFILYYSPEIISIIVSSTNSYKRKSSEPLKPYNRVKN